MKMIELGSEFRTTMKALAHDIECTNISRTQNFTVCVFGAQGVEDIEKAIWNGDSSPLELSLLAKMLRKIAASGTPGYEVDLAPVLTENGGLLRFDTNALTDSKSNFHSTLIFISYTDHSGSHIGYFVATDRQKHLKRIAKSFEIGDLQEDKIAA